MSKSAQEQMQRVELMADGDSTRDLSDNDIKALKYVLAMLAEKYALVESLEAANRINSDEWKQRVEFLERERDAWKRIATDLRNAQDTTTATCYSEDEKKARKAYDALAEPKRGK